MPRFTFDENRTPEQNIQLFYEHLRSVDIELATLLQTVIAELLPLPEAGADRGAKRLRANNLVRRTLDLRS